MNVDDTSFLFGVLFGMGSMVILYWWGHLVRGWSCW